MRFGLAASVAAALLLPLEACGGCDDYHCAGGESIVLELAGLDDAHSASICFDADCDSSAVGLTGGKQIPYVSRSMAASTLARGQHFDLSVDVLDHDGEVLAHFSDSAHRKSDDECGCGIFGYEWSGRSFHEQ